MSLSTSPKLISGGLILMAPGGSTPRQTIALQYNPDSLSRSYQVQGSGGDAGAERATPFRLKGPAIETLKLEAEIDATDALEHPELNPAVVASGIAPQLAALEAMVNPSVAELQALDALAAAGTLEIVPPEAPLVLFVWGAGRVVPVRVTELSVAEEAFDARLNPVRAKVSLGLRVLSVDDLGFQHKGGALFLNHLRSRENLAAQAGSAAPGALGLNQLP